MATELSLSLSQHVALENELRQFVNIHVNVLHRFRLITSSSMELKMTTPTTSRSRPRNVLVTKFRGTTAWLNLTAPRGLFTTPLTTTTGSTLLSASPDMQFILPHQSMPQVTQEWPPMSPILTSQAELHLSPILTSQAGPPITPILMSQAGPHLSHILTSPVTLMQPPRSATVTQWGTDTRRATWNTDMAATINSVTRSLSCQQTDFCYLNLRTQFCSGFNVSMAFGNKFS